MQLSDPCIGDIAVDESDNIYITARGDREERGPGGYFTIMYDSEGNEIWVSQYVSAEYNYDWSNALAVDNEGNVYVTGAGMVNGNAGNYDYATVKYDGNGNQLWVARYGITGEQRCYAKALAIDSAGDVYVTGACGTVKYDSEGRQLWSTPCDSAEGCENSASALALDNSGNLYVTGQSGTIKYDGDGNQLWRVDYTPVEYESYHKWDIAVDKSDNAYVIGPNVVENSNEYSVVKYDADGVQHWSRQHIDPDVPKCKFREVTTDEYGNVYVAGHDVGFVTVKYDGDGNQLWVASGCSKDKRVDWEVSDIALDGSGNIYVAGTAIRLDESYRKDEWYRMIIARYVQY
ncbi:MAG: SBBP repeat-containing protein [Dehalococcoidia bacterium]